MAKKYQFKLKGYVGGYDFDADFVDYKLSILKGQSVSVLIDSLGGSLATALSIASAFRIHGDVSVHFSGLNASAATVASLGAKHISMDASAMYLVHKCSNMIFTWDSFNADQLESMINELSKQKNDLDKLDMNIAAMYARKCKKDSKALLELMKVGGWMNASEALEWGFIDEIADCDSAPVLTDSIASALALEGIPVPDIPFASKDSAFGKFLNSLTSLFQSKTTNNAKVMPIKSNLICKVLGIENLECKDGVVALSESQIASLENAFLINDNTIKQQETAIADLSKKPADDTTNVVNSSADDSKDEISEFAERVNNTRELFNSLI